MTVNVSALVAECMRRGVVPDIASSERTAHSLLEVLTVPPGTVLQWGACRDWQLEMFGDIVLAGSFEDCVTDLSQRCPL